MKIILTANECGRQDSNLYGLSRYPLSARGVIVQRLPRPPRLPISPRPRAWIASPQFRGGWCGLNPAKVSPHTTLTATYSGAPLFFPRYLSSLAFTVRIHFSSRLVKAPVLARLSMVEWMLRRFASSSLWRNDR